jgi:hypothetical protein
MSVIAHTWRILHRTDLGHRHDSLIPEGAPIPAPDAELRVIEVVPAEQLRGAVEERDALRDMLTRLLYGDDDGSTRVSRSQEAVELLDRLGGQ